MKAGKEGTGWRAWLKEKSSTAFILVDLKRQKGKPTQISEIDIKFLRAKNTFDSS